MDLPSSFLPPPSKSNPLHHLVLIGVLLKHILYNLCILGNISCVCRDQAQGSSAQHSGKAWNDGGGKVKGATADSFYCWKKKTITGKGTQRENAMQHTNWSFTQIGHKQKFLDRVPEKELKEKRATNCTNRGRAMEELQSIMKSGGFNQRKWGLMKLSIYSGRREGLRRKAREKSKRKKLQNPCETQGCR